MIGDKRIDPQHTLTISGPGRLDATSGRDYAGIGGANTDAQKNIVINGGYIYSSAGTNGGAGIGGNLGASLGNITINDGDIRIISSHPEDGKSSCIGYSADGSCGDITFNGGKVMLMTTHEDYYISSNGNVRFGSDCHIRFYDYNRNHTDKVIGNVYFDGTKVSGFPSGYGVIVPDEISSSYYHWCYPDYF